MTSYTTRVIARLPMVCEARGPRLNTPDIAAEICKDMAGLAQECFQVLTLDQKHKVIDRHMVALGSLTDTMVHPREVFRLAYLDCAAAVMFVHNHPSGDPEPSLDDRKITDRLMKAAEILGIRVLDHVIVGREGRFVSFHDRGFLERQGE